jgi:hypothetical protein
VLEEHPHVLQVVNKHHYIKVKFDTGITEHWALTPEGLEKQHSFELPLGEGLFTDHEIPSFKQFETNKILYPEDYEVLKNHFIIKRKDLEKAGWCEARFKAHDLAVELVEEGYVPIQYTGAILDEDLEILRNEDLKRYQTSLIRFSAFSSIPPSGRRLIMHFMPCHARNCWDFYSIYKTINKLMHRDFTREDIVYYLSKDNQISRHPAFYRALFNQWFDISGKRVLDMDPNWGFKALAVLIEGGEYHCTSPYLPNLQEMAEYMGGTVSAPDGDKYDLVIISDAVPVSIGEVDVLLTKYHGVGEYLMLSIKVDTIDDWKGLIEKHKPERVLRVNNRMINTAKDDNMIMIIRS